MTSFIPTRKLVAVAGFTLTSVALAACSQEVGTGESTAESQDDLFRGGPTWPNNQVTVCFDSGNGNRSDLIAEAQRTLAATWGRASRLTFKGRFDDGSPSTSWLACDYTRRETGNYSTIAVHFCDGASTASSCSPDDYVGKCTAGTCASSAECGQHGTCVAGKCTSGRCTQATDCGSAGGACQTGVRRANGYRGYTSSIGQVPFVTNIIGITPNITVLYDPGVTHVSLSGDDTDFTAPNFMTRFHYQVVHEFGHALGFRHEQDRPDNFDQCKENVHKLNVPPGEYLTPLIDYNSTMSYCNGDPIANDGFLTRLGGGDRLGVRGPYGQPSAHGFMITSDGNASLALHANGAVENGIPKLKSGCTVANPECTWTYTRGMLISDKDPTLALKRILNSGGKYEVRLVRAGLIDPPVGTLACTPAQSNCRWTYKLGMFQNDADLSYGLNARGGSIDGVDVGVSPACNTGNSSCMWTLPNVMLTSDRNISLAINAHGGAVDKNWLVLHNACDPTNNSCTFTFSRGMIRPTGDLSLAWNAFGGSAHGNSLLVNRSCTETNNSCLWTWSRGQILSDGSGIPVNASGGAFHLAQLKLNSTGNANNPDCVFSGSFAR